MKKDGKMAAANDSKEVPFNEGLKDGVEKVISKIKVKKLPNVVTTADHRVIQSKYVYKPEERADVAGKLAQRQIELVEAEEEKKSVVARYADKVKAVKLEVNTLSRKYRDGWEYRDHDCVVIYDYKKRVIIFKDVNTKKIIDNKPFGPGDDQRRFL